MARLRWAAWILPLVALWVVPRSLFPSPSALAQEAPGPRPETPPATVPEGLPGSGTKTLLEAWQEAWTPGEAHARLAQRTGVWKLTTRTWSDPSEEPVVTETTAIRSMILGGRCLEERVVGEIQGMPFESRGYLGYDNVTHRWWSTWMDTLSTAVVVTTGTSDPDAKEIVLAGEYSDPLTGQQRQVRTVVRFVDRDTEEFEWWERRGDREVKTMEILYQRQGLSGLGPESASPAPPKEPSPPAPPELRSPPAI